MHVIKAMSMRGDMDEGKASTCSMTCIKVDESWRIKGLDNKGPPGFSWKTWVIITILKLGWISGHYATIWSSYKRVRGHMDEVEIVQIEDEAHKVLLTRADVTYSVPMTCP